MLRHVKVVDELLCAGECDVAYTIAGHIISCLSIEPVLQGDCFDHMLLGNHLDRFEPVLLAPIPRTVLLCIDRTSCVPRDQLTQLLFDCLVLHSQFLTLVAHGAPLGNILVLHADDGLKAVLLLSCSLALRRMNHLTTCIASVLF